MKLYTQTEYYNCITNSTCCIDLMIIMEIIFKEATSIIKEYGFDYYNTLVTVWEIKKNDFI